MTDITEKLKKFDNNKLIDVVKNYRQHGYDENTRSTAISILEDRGITKEDLQLTGNFENKTYDYAKDLYNTFKNSSTIAFISYFIVVITNILTQALVIKENSLAITFLIINIGATLTFLIFLIKAYLNQNNFYKAIQEDHGTENLFLYVLGIPFYIVLYFYIRKQMEEKMKEID